MMSASSLGHTTDRPWSTRFLIGVCTLGGVFSILAGIAPLIVLGGLAALSLLLWCFMSPVWSLCLVIALSSLFVRSTEDITVLEIAYALLFAAVILGWAGRRLATGQPFTLTRTDRALVWYLAICLASLVPAILYGNDLVKWVRELNPFLLFVPYLLVVTTVRHTREIRWLCVAFVILSVTMGIINLIEYRESVVKAQYFWELLAGRRALNEPLFFITLTVLIVLIAFEGFRGWRTVGYLALVLFFTAVLAITFSRGYWVATLLALLYALVQMPPDRRRVVLGFIAGLTLLGVVTITLLGGPRVAEVASAVAERFGSLTSAALDLSLKNRLAESAAVLDLIARNPIVGYGLGFFFSFRALIPVELPTWYAHNAYLFLWLKLGVFGLVAFLVFYLSVVVHGARAYRRIEDPFVKPLVLGILSVMVAMIPLSVTSPQFIQKDSILFLALGMGIIEFVYRDTDTIRRRGDESLP